MESMGARAIGIGAFIICPSKARPWAGKLERGWGFFGGGRGWVRTPWHLRRRGRWRWPLVKEFTNKGIVGQNGEGRHVYRLRSATQREEIIYRGETGHNNATPRRKIVKVFLQHDQVNGVEEVQKNAEESVIHDKG
jgi:hypothetical protein